MNSTFVALVGLAMLLQFIWSLVSTRNTRVLIERESNKLFKMMVNLQYRDYSERELKAIYPALCKSHGFDEV